mgnify:CR=1 FL=1
MSRFRAALVSSPTLASVGLSLDLGDQLRLGSGELRPLLQEIKKNLRAKRYASSG